MKHFMHWLSSRISPRKASPDPKLGKAGARPRPTDAHLRRPVVPAAARAPRARQPEAARQPAAVDVNPHLDGRIQDNGPGKNVLIRNKYVREDTGTHETLTILDDSMLETDEEAGMDPYNTGQFDRSKHWDKRLK
ncbi:MAG: hypothetical protein OEM85_12420 [Gammaproteobacteria bacterium]|nr:hypothetical protein [Gammaproteobacteria bacterium]MDH3374169.1 hypothetical protein [Gammaproteobacteria bacterium]MDH3409838.1 hypothetical protein [Gammaproteobacteria bacterium]